jgi:DNA primase
MYYPDELVEEVRARSDIVNVIGSYIRLQKKGSSHMGLCPFHNEKTPSFSVSASRQIYHCFGCGVGGNVFTFIMEYENYTFVEALKLLAERAGIALPEREYTEEERRQADLRSRLFEVNKKAAKYFYYRLKSPDGEAARRYLAGRSLSEDIIKQFGLGYASKYSDDLYKYLKGEGYDDGFLKTSGLISFDEVRGAHDKFWDRVIFPIMDINNRVIGFGGRVMGKSANELAKYLNSPETSIFNKGRSLYALNLARRSKEPYFLVCEGYMDVITLHQAGFSNAVAALGTALTSFHANLLKRYKTEAVLTFDSDEAGIQASLRAIPLLKEAGMTVKVLNMEPYKDPDDFIKALGTEEFKKRIEQARNSFFFEIEVMQREYDLNDPEQKTRFFQEIARKLTGFSDELERNIYIEAAAKTYNIGVDMLRKLVDRLALTMYTAAPEAKVFGREAYKNKKPSEEGLFRAQSLLLTWLSEDEALFNILRDVLGPEDFTEGICTRVAQYMYEQHEMGQKVEPAGIISRFESMEEQSEASLVFALDIPGEMTGAIRQKALIDTVCRVMENSLDKQSLQAIEDNNTVRLQEIIRQKLDLRKKVTNLLS